MMNAVLRGVLSGQAYGIGKNEMKRKTRKNSLGKPIATHAMRLVCKIIRK